MLRYSAENEFKRCADVAPHGNACGIITNEQPCFSTLSYAQIAFQKDDPAVSAVEVLTFTLFVGISLGAYRNFRPVWETGFFAKMELPQNVQLTNT